MNDLVEKYGTDKVAVLGFICNQFGHQSNGDEGEFVNVLEHVRPGSGFKCADGVELFAKCEVNGAGQLPLFKWMKERQRVPFGNDGDNKGNGVQDNDALTQGDKSVLWSPIARGDIGWNFEKFLIVRHEHCCHPRRTPRRTRAGTPRRTVAGTNTNTAAAPTTNTNTNPAQTPPNQMAAGSGWQVREALLSLLSDR